MKAKYIKSENGDITVVSLGGNLLIRVLHAPPAGSSFFISNPDTSNDPRIGVITVDVFKPTADIFEAIDQQEVAAPALSWLPH